MPAEGNTENYPIQFDMVIEFLCAFCVCGLSVWLLVEDVDEASPFVQRLTLSLVSYSRNLKRFGLIYSGFAELGSGDPSGSGGAGGGGGAGAGNSGIGNGDGRQEERFGVSPMGAGLPDVHYIPITADEKLLR